MKAKRDDPMYCPVEITESLLRYWHKRSAPGSFLYAVLTNDLLETIFLADQVNIRHLPGIVRFCHEQLPGPAWGSPAKVRAWLAGDPAKLCAWCGKDLEPEQTVRLGRTSHGICEACGDKFENHEEG